MNDLDTFEDELIEQFRRHPVLANIESLSDADFADVLLQRRFLSLAFTPAYDLVIDLLQDEPAVRIARVILREEYPDSRGYTPSHREDMKEDLFQLGVSREDFVGTRPTKETLHTITATIELIADAGLDRQADLRLLTILRLWGEILVSVEYGELWRRMAARLIVNGENRSRFYYPHHVHDAKATPVLRTSLLAATHSDRLGARLDALLVSDEARTCFKEVEQDVVRLKSSFYDQFTAKL